MAKYTFTIC